MRGKQQLFSQPQTHLSSSCGLKLQKLGWREGILSLHPLNIWMVSWKQTPVDLLHHSLLEPHCNPSAVLSKLLVLGFVGLQLLWHKPWTESCSGGKKLGKNKDSEKSGWEGRNLSVLLYWLGRWVTETATDSGRCFSGDLSCQHLISNSYSVLALILDVQKGCMMFIVTPFCSLSIVNFPTAPESAFEV